MGVSYVRFAELKIDKDNFVDLAKVFEYQYGLNDDPFVNRCWQNTVINDVNVNFRQMCGMQTNLRVKPENPEQILKKVLYYDGILYDGWRQVKEKKEMSALNKKSKRDIANLLTSYANGETSLKDAVDKIAEIVDKSTTTIINNIIVQPDSPSATGAGCVY